ncbi:hypothetical protein M409DRAFT_64236 [Zasmidium cellare ATCC 36951]|uniref:Rhodopsin domain-containing protein n=1 Tax=Zasmidium cellare ATCC 36951 TaxID=1080233 RepID=A0A6A6CU15_ZASCE|nr:uncharacterized protein M409DRAFT_64236 [Zasmidium cellare ATCC 36951]KAF2170535.1 hypothetical protein M409DRAFT_64236 [Zasmidium cellare ATCC 36951]
MALLEAFVAKEVLEAFCILGIVVTSVVGALRAYVRIAKQGRLHEDDLALFFGLALYITLCALYIADIPYLYSVMGWLSGHTQLSQKIVADYTQMMRYNYAVTMFFWAVLWSVKISLLLFFRRVILNTNFIRAWWVILAFTILTFIGCVISQFTSCDSIHDFTRLGACSSPRNQRAQIISLYYSFAVDVLTDILIMAFPLRILMTLKMSVRDKWVLACLFSVTIIAIVVSILRVFFIYAKTGNSTPSPPWLGFWAVVECMVSIIVGCIPAISQIFRTSGPNSSQYYKSGSGSGSGSRSNPRQRSYDPGVYSGSGSAKTTVETSAKGSPSSESSRELHPGPHRIQSRTEIIITDEDADYDDLELRELYHGRRRGTAT